MSRSSFSIERRTAAIKKGIPNLVGSGVTDPVLQSNLIQAMRPFDQLQRQGELLLEGEFLACSHMFLP
jgi:hypothetical protein